MGRMITKKTFALLAVACLISTSFLQAADLRVGSAAVNLEADDKMIIAGGIGPGYAEGQEGQLRAVAVVIEKPGAAKLAIVGCDVLFVTRDFVDRALARIEKSTGIPPAHVLVNASHTHHAPSTARLHGYGPDAVFCRRLEDAIVTAVEGANARLPNSDADFYFHLGEENTIGANSRLLLSDNTIFWIGDSKDRVRPTGPFDPQLPVLAFRNPADQKLRAVIYNHSTHTIGTRTGRVRSAGFYGLAAQELEMELGGHVCFLEGASGSTHNIGGPGTAEAVKRLKAAVGDALAKAEKHPVGRLAAIKRPFSFKVRTFDEAVEDEKVTSYCRKRAAAGADSTIDVFRQMRKELKPEQGKTRETRLQVMLIGDVATVGVPAEYFTSLGVDIKRRSPFRNTYVAELSNDWIGYLPDREGHELGGYQTWMGLHSFAEVGTGERIADQVIEMLSELAP
jgi:hypothetical protein